MGKIGEHDEFEHCFETGDVDTLRHVWESYEKIVTLSEELMEKREWDSDDLDAFVNAVVTICGCAAADKGNKMDERVQLVWSPYEGGEIDVILTGTYEECLSELRRLDRDGEDLEHFDLRSVATGRFVSWVL